MYLKYDNMNTNGIINAFICINNHVNSCIKCMLSSIKHPSERGGPLMKLIHTVIENTQMCVKIITKLTNFKI